MEENQNIDSFVINEKIKREKRRRNQVYMALDYLNSRTNKFDFLSSSSISILKVSKNLTINFKKEKLSSDFILFSYFKNESEIIKLLEKFNITIENIEKYLTIGHELTKNKNSGIFSNFQEKNFSNNDIEYNFEVKILIEKAIENSYRFKTPVITPEILLLTLLEEKTLSAGILIRKILKNDIQWNLLRYEILKKIHYQETKVQGNMYQKYRYFAYLIKNELEDTKFDKLLEKSELSFVIQSYRNLLVSKILQLNISDFIEHEIKVSMNSNNLRHYSK